jgi:hypothetical protein
MNQHITQTIKEERLIQFMTQLNPEWNKDLPLLPTVSSFITVTNEDSYDAGAIQFTRVLFFLNEVVKFFGFVSIRRKRKAQCINTYA